MKTKRILAFIIFIFISLPLLAEIKVTGFSFSPEIGFLNGKVMENVWRANMSYSNSKITYSPTSKESQLDWNIDNMFYFGFNINGTFNKRISLEFNFKNAISGTCGVMEDFDWQNAVDITHLTDYSIHTNILENLTQVNFTIGYLFYLNKNHSITMTPKIGFETQKIAFSGINGWGIYEKYNWAITSYEGRTVITYEQSYLSPYFKLSTNFSLFKYFETNIDLFASMITEMNCYDFHYRSDRLYVYNDIIKNSWKIGTDISLYWIINKNNKLGIKSGISYIPDAFGFTYMDYNENPLLSNLGGTNRFLWTYSLVYVLYF